MGMSPFAGEARRAMELYSKAITLSVKEQGLSHKLMAAVYCNRSLSYKQLGSYAEVNAFWASCPRSTLMSVARLFKFKLAGEIAEAVAVQTACEHGAMMHRWR